MTCFAHANLLGHAEQDLLQKHGYLITDIPDMFPPV
jgi:hypothetical protein